MPFKDKKSYREYQKSYKRKRRKDDPNWCNRYQPTKEQKDRWSKENQESLKLMIRKCQLEKNYGLTVEGYIQMFVSQKGLCAICGLPETAKYKGTVRRLSVDHDHFTNKVRKLLCSRCNTAIGMFDDDVLKMQAAVAYINDHRRGD